MIAFQKIWSDNIILSNRQTKSVIKGSHSVSNEFFLFKSLVQLRFTSILNQDKVDVNTMCLMLSILLPKALTCPSKHPKHWTLNVIRNRLGLDFLLGLVRDAGGLARTEICDTRCSVYVCRNNVCVWFSLYRHSSQIGGCDNYCGSSSVTMEFWLLSDPPNILCWKLPLQYEECSWIQSSGQSSSKSVGSLSDAWDAALYSDSRSLSKPVFNQNLILKLEYCQLVERYVK
jgi:hypothetical protein